MPIDASQVKWDDIDVKAVKWDDAPDGFSFPKAIGKGVMNAAAGAVRGAGSIGSTILAPRDALEGFIARKMGAPELQPADRRAPMTRALGNMGADTDSLAFGAGKIGTEIAGTAGIGGLFAKGAQAAGAGPAVVNALRTGGMTTGAAPVGFLAKAGDLALRSGAGAAVGGAGAGMVNPDDAGMGAAIGGLAPGVLKAGGSAGGWTGRKLWDMLTPDVQKRAVQLAQLTGKSIDEIVSGLGAGGPSLIPGSQKTVPQILQDPNISQVARTLQNQGQYGLVNREAQNNLARIAAIERVAPTAGTVNEARANAGEAIANFAKSGEAAASRKVQGLFNAIPDDVTMHLPLDQMGEAQAKYLGPGSFGKGLQTVSKATATARGIGTEILEAMKAAPVERQQSLYEAVLSAGGIHKNSPSGRQLLGELKDLQASKQGSSVRANSGKSADKLAQEMHARGFIPDEDPATLIQYLKDAGRDTFAADASIAGRYARQAEAAMGDMPGAETISKSVPFSQIQNLRSSIGEAITDAQKNGQKQAAAALTAMKSAIDDKVALVAGGGGQADEVFSPQSVNIWRKALAAHADKKLQFNTGQQAQIFRAGQNGQPMLEGAQVAPLFWNGGNNQARAIEDFGRLTGGDDRLARLLKSNAMTELLDQAKGAKGPLSPDGTLTANGVDKWMRNHSGGVEALFNPGERATLRAIQNETGAAGAADALGMAKGSNTAQNIFSAGALDSKLLNAAANGVKGLRLVTGPALEFVKKSSAENRNKLLAALLEDPELIAKTLQASKARDATGNKLAELLRSPQAQQMLYRSAPVISAQ